MARPTFQHLDDVYSETQSVLDALPDTTERRSAERCLNQSKAYAFECREKVRNQEPDE